MLIIFLLFFSVFLLGCEDKPQNKAETQKPLKQDIISKKITYPEPLNKENSVPPDNFSSTTTLPDLEKEIKKPDIKLVDESILEKDMSAPNPVLTITLPSGEENAQPDVKKNAQPDVKKNALEKKSGTDPPINQTMSEKESLLQPDARKEFANSSINNAAALMMGETQDMLLYTGEGRIDPFEPLIKAEKKVAVQVKLEPEKPKRNLTPLEKLDFSQMTLVAIVNSETDSVAMVEESSGKGYVVKVGTYMGQNGGQVERIETDRIIIKEMVKNYKGLETTRFQELKLHKDKG